MNLKQNINYILLVLVEIYNVNIGKMSPNILCFNVDNIKLLTFSFPRHDNIERKQLLDYNWKFAPGDHLLLKVINNKK